MDTTQVTQDEEKQNKTTTQYTLDTTTRKQRKEDMSPLPQTELRILK